MKRPRDRVKPHPGTIVTVKGRIDMRRLSAISARPRPFSGGELSFWTDPYVSKHLLNAHLDEERDEATRRPEWVARTVDAVLRRCETGPRLLDLACGPGIYAQLFARRGCTVVGIDFSKNSIDYASRENRKEKLDVEYICGDVRTTAYGGPFDVVTMIFGEFCTFSNADQKSILRKIRDSMEPGGLLVLDVFTRPYAERYHSGGDWYVGARDGFWQKESHLVLEQSFHYPEHSATVRRYTIVEADGGYRQYSIWWHYFAPKEITELLESAGFTVEDMYGNLWEGPMEDDTEWIGLFCRRE